MTSFNGLSAANRDGQGSVAIETGPDQGQNARKGSQSDRLH
jgi:hypothetical protein